MPLQGMSLPSAFPFRLRATSRRFAIRGPLPLYVSEGGHTPGHLSSHPHPRTLSPPIPNPVSSHPHLRCLSLPYLTGSARSRFRSLCRHALPHEERWKPFSLPLPSRFTSRGALGAVFAPSAVTLYLTRSARGHFRSRSRHSGPLPPVSSSPT